MITATAPGKVMLAGEYAVLEGGPAVLVAVDLRVLARVVAAPVRPSDFLAAVAAEIADRYGASSAAARAAGAIEVDSTALCDPAGGDKLGLGSSAAVTVAAVAASLVAGGLDADAATVHQLAHRAHARAQAARGSRGSGADVAASVYGGAVVVSRDPAGLDQPVLVTRRLLPADLHLVLAWTRAAADTAVLVAHAERFRDRHPTGYQQACAPLAQAAAELATALELGDATAAVAALAAGGRAIANFGRVVALPVESPLHRRLREIAKRAGGTAKPTGAGVGDMAVAAFASAAAAESFRRDARALGLPLIPAAVAQDGFQVTAG